MFNSIKEVLLQDTEDYIIANSITLNIGDACYFKGSAGSGGFLTNMDSTSARVYGIVAGFVASPGGSAQGNLTTTQVVAASNNQTVAQYRARVIPVRGNRMFLADLNQAAGTTTGSGDPGYFGIKTTNSGQLDETTYVVETGTIAQFFSTGSGLATSNNGPTGLFPATSSQVIGFFDSTYAV